MPSERTEVGDDEKTEMASRLVWWIARLASKQMGFQPRPQVGDMVVEITHTLGLARRRLGLLSAVGELLRVEAGGPLGPVYVIRNLNGEEARWENAQLVTIEKGRCEKEEAPDAP